uniref:ADP-ribosylation factor-like 6 interacting protein 6 n=1 Tax=Monopterus albus TaxID=43700 RepID=A0A3Q3JRW5_MONAL|nr:ADP-ribosylation factor-like protein 6-interacting protein 6 [Monopterus albus]
MPSKCTIMLRIATDRDAGRGSFFRSYSPEDMEQAETHFVSHSVTARHGHGDRVRTRSKQCSVVILSVLGSAVVVAAVGFFCALIYPILKELRAEKVRREDGTEQRMLGFWSILVLSVLVGCICCSCSWSLTYFNLYQPGIVFPAPLVLVPFRDTSAHSFHMGYGVAVLNGIMAMLTVIWSLT